MAVYVRKDSPNFWVLLEGHADASGNSLKEPTKIRIDAPTPQQRKDNRSLAEAHYHTRMTELAAEHSDRTVRRQSILFSVFLTWWEKHKLPTRRGKEREAIILPRFRQAFGHLPITAITRHRVSEWITERLATATVIEQKGHRREVKATASTVNREVDTLKAILQAAVPTYLEVSPLYGMKRLPSLTPRRRLLTAEEETRLLAIMEPDDKALFLLGLDGLVRLSDCLDVRRADDHKTAIWIADPKTGGGFDVPVSTRLRKALDAIKGKAEYYFARRRVAKTERDRRGAIRQMLEMYCRKATPPIPYGRKAGGITFHHATRRTGATRMLTSGHDLGTVQKVGRWKDPTVVISIYHELIDDKARAAVESVGKKPRRQKPKQKKAS
jgi:hypothetical protein